MLSTQGLFFFLMSTLLRTHVSHWRPLSNSMSPLTPVEVLCYGEKKYIPIIWCFFFYILRLQTDSPRLLEAWNIISKPNLHAMLHLCLIHLPDFQWKMSRWGLSVGIEWTSLSTVWFYTAALLAIGFTCQYHIEYDAQFVTFVSIKV